MLGRQAQPQRPVEQRRRLLSAQPQVRDPHLEQLGARPQPRQRQRRIAASGHRHLHRPREVVDEKLRRLVHVGVADRVIVIEDQHDRIRQRGERVDQQRQRQLGPISGRRPQCAFHPSAHIRYHRAQRRQHIIPEANRSLSRLSSDSQANGRCSTGSARQLASTVVLPAPAGAETRISRALEPSRSSATRLGRETRPAGSSGTCSFVATSGPPADSVSWVV